jgi:hypothetical protein
MLSTLVLVAALVAQQPPPYSERGFGGMPHKLSPAEKKLANSPWDVNRTKHRAHNRYARRYEELRLTPSEAVWFMRTHQDLYRPGRR